MPLMLPIAEASTINSCVVCVELLPQTDTMFVEGLQDTGH